jgi:hypothetical protein
MADGTASSKPGAANGTTRKTKADYATGENPPPTLPVNPAGIPGELQARPQWVSWKWFKRDGKWTKVPINPRTGGNARAADPSTWASFAEALGRGGAGVGYEFSADDPFAGVDLDDCRDPDTGDLDPWAADQLARLDTYAEVSPTGTGAKAVVRAIKPPGRCEGDYQGHKIELYDRGRFFALTGCALPESRAEVAERQAALDALYRQVFGNGQPRGKRKAEARPDGPGDCERALAALAGLGAWRAAVYETWLQVGMALHSVDAGPAMLSAWDQWSRYCPEKYQGGACAAKWATFKQDGAITLGSLIHWAREDGGSRARATGTAGQERRPRAAGGEGRSAVEVIQDYFRERYQPLFKRDNAIYCTDGSEVPMMVACAVPDSRIIDRLSRAADAPQYKGGGVNHGALPGFFTKWARVAWGDLLRELPEEDADDRGHSCPAREDFRKWIRAVLVQEVTLGDVIGHAGVSQTERNSLIGWCVKFAKTGPWRKIRSKECYCKLVDLGGGEVRLRVAIHPELFTQVGAERRLRSMSGNTFTRRAAKYGVGTTSRADRPQGRSAVVLNDDFVADLTAGIPDEDDANSDPPCP